jgi:PBP1b-binding outer membrane lipoprotein LpoB
MLKNAIKASGNVKRITAKEIVAAVLILLALLSIVFVSGCVEQQAIKSEKEVGEAVTNISSDVDDVTEILEDIDTQIG